jgi:CO/xanthine dehydrogenase FAD-binding subunit
MKASAFAHARPNSADKALEPFASRWKASVLSDGLGLIPAMNLRLIASEWIVDIGGFYEPRGITGRGEFCAAVR